MTLCENQLASRLSEIEAWQQKDREVMMEFLAVVGGAKNPFYPQLLRIFKKKVSFSSAACEVSILTMAPMQQVKVNAKGDKDGQSDDVGQALSSGCFRASNLYVLRDTTRRTATAATPVMRRTIAFARRAAIALCLRRCWSCARSAPSRRRCSTNSTQVSVNV